MSLQIDQAVSQYHDAGKPLSGAMRVASLHIAADDERPLAALFAACLASHGHSPGWPELRALVEAARTLRPRTFASGDPVTISGHRTEALYIVHAGAVRVDGRDWLDGPMSVHGAWSAFSGGLCRHTVVAARASILLSLPAAMAETLARSCPAAGRLVSGQPARQVTDGEWPRATSG